MRCGVDFGTTRTTVAVVDRGNYPVVSFHDDLDDTFDYIPSVMALEGDHPVFGFRAVRLAADGAPHLHSFKRLLADPDVTTTTTVRLAHRDINVQSLVEGFLRHVAREVRTASSVAEVPDEEPLEASVGIPAHAHSAQRFMTLEAFRSAGWTVTAMLNEPSAAGFEYTHRHAGTVNSKRRHVLVYDLGGGTFDASMVAVDGTTHDVLGSRGNNMLGGDDFDEVLATLALRSSRTSTASLGDGGWARLVESAREAKESLTPQTRYLTLEVLGSPVTVPVADFYREVSPLIESTVETMEPLLRRTPDGAEALGEDVAGLYVVGGASELPAVSRALRGRFGRRVHRSPHSAASTAIGLAISADPDAGYVLRERLSRGVGVFRERESGSRVSFDPLLDPGMRVSTEESVSLTRTYRAAHDLGWYRFVEYTSTDPDGVPRSEVVPYGDLVVPFDPALQALTDVDLRSLPVHRTDQGPLVEERYTVDPHGIVTVTVTDLDTGYSVSRTLGGRA